MFEDTEEMLSHQAMDRMKNAMVVARCAGATLKKSK
jgi:hypothetical protein